MRLLLGLLALVLFSTPAVSAQEGSYRPDTSNPNGPELFAVFITQSTCVWSNREGFDETVERAKQLLADQADREGLGFAVRGVVLDWNPRGGVDYLLDRFGAFDEVAAGRNWYSADAEAYIWEAEGGAPSTPQLIVFRRTVADTELDTAFSDEEMLARFVGVMEIEALVEAGRGVPLD